MLEYDILAVHRVLDRCIQVILEEKEELTDIDSHIGDGDMGTSMEKGALALKDAVDSYKGDFIGEMLICGGTSFNRAAPSTMGTLISMALVTVGQKWKQKSTLTPEDIVSAPRQLEGAISKFGKAKLGDKTILDALIPYCNVLELTFSQNGDLGDSLYQAALAAEQGAESTKGMKAKSGRARWLAERNCEYPDGGAVLCARIAMRLALDFKELKEI